MVGIGVGGIEPEGESESEGTGGPHLRAKDVTRPVTHRLVPLRVIDGPRVLLTRNSHRWLQLRSFPLRACWQRDPGWRAAEREGRLGRAPTQDLPPEGGPGSKTAIPLCERGTGFTCARPRRTRAGARASLVQLRTRRGRRRQGGCAGTCAQRALLHAADRSITCHLTFVLGLERASRLGSLLFFAWCRVALCLLKTKPPCCVERGC